MLTYTMLLVFLTQTPVAPPDFSKGHFIVPPNVTVLKAIDALMPELMTLKTLDGESEEEANQRVQTKLTQWLESVGCGAEEVLGQSFNYLINARFWQRGDRRIFVQLMLTRLELGGPEEASGFLAKRYHRSDEVVKKYIRHYVISGTYLTDTYTFQFSIFHSYVNSKKPETDESFLSIVDCLFAVNGPAAFSFMLDSLGVTSDDYKPLLEPEMKSKVRYVTENGYSQPRADLRDEVRKTLPLLYDSPLWVCHLYAARIAEGDPVLSKEEWFLKMKDDPHPLVREAVQRAMVRNAKETPTTTSPSPDAQKQPAGK